jgi:ferrous iron transport protein A
MIITLCELKIGETGVIVNIETDKALKKRLQDIGLIRGSKIKPLHSSPCGNPRAYLIKGCVIALRNCDAEKILVSRGGACEKKC